MNGSRRGPSPTPLLGGLRRPLPAVRRLGAPLVACVLAGCAPARAPEAAPDLTEGPAPAREAEAPWWLGGSFPYRDPATGLSLVVPDGWAVRAGRGDVLLEARGPAGSGLRVELRRWDGDPASLDLDGEEPTDWLSDGPFLPDLGGLDRTLLVSTHDARTTPPALRFGWHVASRGSGVSILGWVPRPGLEAGLTAVRRIVDSARLEEEAR